IMQKINLTAIIFFLFIVGSIFGQSIDNAIIKEKISAFKKDTKGPYQQIMWFCPDGSKVPPPKRCLEKGGVQRATYKPWIDLLAQENHIFLGQILATTDYAAFLDESDYYSRLKQYQIEQYLEAIDNGWILQKAKYYRGAFQDEDENAWGASFLQWMTAEKSLEKSHYFLLKQAFRTIPHKTENSNIQKVRALSMEIADSIPSFMNIRIKIHGQPDAADIQAVKEFKKKNGLKLSLSTGHKMDELIKEMELMYRPADWQSLRNFQKELGANTESGKLLLSALDEISKTNSVSKRVGYASELMLGLRKSILSSPLKTKAAQIDLSNRIEDLIFKELPNWETKDLADLMEKNYLLAQCAVGSGFIELWEWDKIAPKLKPLATEEISLAQLNAYLIDARRIVEWSTAMIRANYGNEIKRFEAFEPMATGFSDDLIRSSILLQLGKTVGDLGDFLKTKSALVNHVFAIPNQGQLRGINPGYAKGELVVSETPEAIEIASDKIYVFLTPPADLKPVAGIATVSEGNLVSHVQLLARNLGIPNAVLSQQNLADLKAFAGKEIFYAVSNKGTVIMKLSQDMTAKELELFAVQVRADEKIKVPIDKMDLNQHKVLNLRQVNASSSGKVCGPKAANLGQLKLMFPDNVVEGIVIPFGIFRQHMDQKMPNYAGSYWEFLNEAFKEAVKMEKEAKEKKEINVFLLGKLEILRNAIQKMPLLPSFIADFKNQFGVVLGKPIGELPVFVRSDTNMEDLKDFTGAGLNLTLFNVNDEQKIFNGIKQVWASPYTERSFQWRQSYLLNPENVYPSILVIPSVNVDYSGVLITKGVSMGTNADLTIAFSRGVGGAVDSQAAETYLLCADGENDLIAPAREPHFVYLPFSGGTSKRATSFESPILTDENRIAIRNFATLLKQKMKETKAMQGPFDVELGFLNNKLWLFQVRPFVENRNAASALYLESITPKIDDGKRIQRNEKL
ncbi:MAG: hypothetical protein JW857_00940, partial [Bacteroidales bacterium]|nr:hypothetical protein [Bacteroidales bacterium]